MFIISLVQQEREDYNSNKLLHFVRGAVKYGLPNRQNMAHILSEKYDNILKICNIGHI